MAKSMEHWNTTDGHRYTSVPINPPLSARYATCEDSKGRLLYVRGPYTIRRETYGRKFSYTVLRDREEIGFLYSRLKDAKAHVERNATGSDVVNVA